MKNNKKVNEPKYLIEKYTDKYRTLYQTIMINIEETNGKESYCARNQISPNLTILLEKEYYDNDMKLIKREQITNDNWYFEE